MVVKKELIDLKKDLNEALQTLNAKNLMQTKVKLYSIEEKIISIRKILFKEGRQEEIARLINCEELVNYYKKELKDINEFELFEIIILELKEKIQSALESINPWIEEEIEESTAQIKVEYSTRYADKKNKKKVYIENKELIRNVESRIEQYFLRGGLPNKSPLAKVDTKKGKNDLHANIPKPLDDHRILYSFDKVNKKIIYLDIGTHKDLGFGNG
ncbi:hypothetical protein J4477_00385 [Candidatus Pacearchaeota archaeon]|nr:hypothetical protein [Candidatus Pacearchaeota archaeon]